MGDKFLEIFYKSFKVEIIGKTPKMKIRTILKETNKTIFLHISIHIHEGSFRAWKYKHFKED